MKKNFTVTWIDRTGRKWTAKFANEQARDDFYKRLKARRLEVRKGEEW